MQTEIKRKTFEVCSIYTELFSWLMIRRVSAGNHYIIFLIYYGNFESKGLVLSLFHHDFTSSGQTVGNMFCMDYICLFFHLFDLVPAHFVHLDSVLFCFFLHRSQGLRFLLDPVRCVGSYKKKHDA